MFLEDDDGHAAIISRPKRRRRSPVQMIEPEPFDRTSGRGDFKMQIGNTLFDGTDVCEARFATGRDDLNATYRSLSGVAFQKRTGKNLNFAPTSFCQNFPYDVKLNQTHERIGI